MNVEVCTQCTGNDLVETCFLFDVQIAERDKLSLSGCMKTEGNKFSIIL